jgi:hypothetical protein
MPPQHGPEPPVAERGVPLNELPEHLGEGFVALGLGNGSGIAVAGIGGVERGSGDAQHEAEPSFGGIGQGGFQSSDVPWPKGR